MSIDLLFADFDRLIQSPESVHRLRRFILDLAVRGKLVPQDPNDEPASELLKRIALEKARLVKAGKIRKPKKIPLIDCSSLLFGAPLGWAWARLSEISRKIHYGFTASAIQQIDDVRLLRITDIQHNKVEWHSVPGCEIDKEAIPNFKLETGDILIARTGGTIGKSFLVAELPVAAVFASYLIRVQGSHEIYARYLKLFLESPIYWTQLREGARGAGQPNVNGQTLGTMLVPLPPLAEQHRIVAKVDELMAFCDRLEAARAEREATRDRLATASLARLNVPDPDPAMFQHDVAFALNNLTPLTTRPDQIKALRQTILNLAVRGKLVQQDTNDEPASDLLKQIAAEKARLVKAGEIKKAKSHLPILPDAPFNLPVGWIWGTVGEICSKTGSGSTPRGGKNTYQQQGIAFLRSQNVYDDELHLHDVAYIDATTHARMSGTMVQPADLLLNITGGSMGRCCRVPDDFDKANVSQHVAIIRIAINGLQDFVHRLILSPYFQSFIFDEQTGAGRGGLPKYKLDRIPVALPPLAEQQRIVDKVDELMVLCDRLEASLATGNENRGQLTDFLLQEALDPDRNCAELTDSR